MGIVLALGTRVPGAMTARRLAGGSDWSRSYAGRLVPAPSCRASRVFTFGGLPTFF